MQIGLVIACALAAQTVAGVASPLTLRDAINEALARSPLIWPSSDQLESSVINERRTKATFAPNLTPAMLVDTSPAGVTERAIGMDLSKLFGAGTDVTLNVAGRRAISAT